MKPFQQKRKFFFGCFSPIKIYITITGHLEYRRLGELPGLPLGSLREKLRELLPKDLQQETRFLGNETVYPMVG